MCSMHRETQWVFVLQRELKGRKLLEDISVDGKVILHFILDLCGICLTAWFKGQIIWTRLLINATKGQGFNIL
jgi:hypothetical protein